MIAGQEIVDDMARGAEAYLQMWERAVGVPAPACRAAEASVTSQGLGRLRLGLTSGQLLRRAGQPQEREGRVWTWCVAGSENEDARAMAVLSTAGFVTMVATTAPGHFLRPAGEPFRFRHGMSKGRRYVAVASRRVAGSPRRLRAQLRLAGLR
jgi:hypothetical protein